MSKLIDFYSGEGTDSEGRTIYEILEWSNDEFEASHDAIQWLFPLKTPSNFNPDAPLLTDKDIQLFKVDPLLQQRLSQSFDRFLRFLALDIEQIINNGDCKSRERCVTIIRKDVNFAEREAIWKYPNHNWLRITRVLASMKMLGGMDGPKVFFECLSSLYNEGYGSPESFSYWQKASEGLIE